MFKLPLIWKYNILVTSLVNKKLFLLLPLPLKISYFEKLWGACGPTKYCLKNLKKIQRTLYYFETGVYILPLFASSDDGKLFKPEKKLGSFSKDLERNSSQLGKK